MAAALSTLFIADTADPWESTLTAVGVACVRADIDSGAFFDEHPHAVINHLAVESDGARIGKYVRHGGIVQFSDAPGRLGAASFGGEHTVAVMKELGYSKEQIEALRVERVIDWEDVNRLPSAL